MKITFEAMLPGAGAPQPIMITGDIPLPKHDVAIHQMVETLELRVGSILSDLEEVKKLMARCAELDETCKTLKAAILALQEEEGKAATPAAPVPPPYIPVSTTSKKSSSKG